MWFKVLFILIKEYLNICYTSKYILSICLQDFNYFYNMKLIIYKYQIITFTIVSFKTLNIYVLKYKLNLWRSFWRLLFELQSYMFLKYFQIPIYRVFIKNNLEILQFKCYSTNMRTKENFDEEKLHLLKT